MNALVINILSWCCLLILIYMVCLNLFHTVILIIASIEVPRYNRQYFLQKGVSLPDDFKDAFSILVPVFNEEKTILDSLRSFLSIDYTQFEVILSNDGSTDGTLDVLKEKYQLVAVNVKPNIVFKSKPIRTVYYSRIEPRLVVIDKDNGGKADSQNAAANLARYKYLCILDADTLLDKGSLDKMTFKFSVDPHVVALGGTVRVINGCRIKDGEVRDISLPKRFCEKVQVLEYLRAFLFGRIGLSASNMLMIISGAFGAFHRDTFRVIRGWNRYAIAEDMDAVVRLHKYIYKKGRPWKIAFIPDPVAWTQAPATLKNLAIQRERWQRGLMQVLFKNFDMCLNPRYKMVGLVGFPYFLIFEMLSALVEFVCYPITILCFIFGVVNLNFFLYFFSLTLVWGVGISLMSVLLHERTYLRYKKMSDFWNLVTICILENFGYRQLHSFWRLTGMIRYILNKSSRSSGAVGWHTIQRESFSQV